MYKNGGVLPLSKSGHCVSCPQHLEAPRGQSRKVRGAQRAWDSGGCWRTARDGALTLQLADAAGEPLESPLPFLPPLQRGDHQFPGLLLPHHQVGDVDVVHLIAGTLEATFEPEHYLPQISFCQPIQLVDGFALCFGGDLGIPIDVGNLLHFYLQG